MTYQNRCELCGDEYIAKRPNPISRYCEKCKVIMGRQNQRTHYHGMSKPRPYEVREAGFASLAMTAMEKCSGKEDCRTCTFAGWCVREKSYLVRNVVV